MTILRTLGAVSAVPAFVLLQGYRDIRARFVGGGEVLMDATNRITAVGTGATGVFATGWPETLLGVLLAAGIVALVAPHRGQPLSRALPLLVATALLAVILVVGMAITAPPGVQDWARDPAALSRWTLWARTGVHGPAAPAMLGVLLVLCAHTALSARRPPSEDLSSS